MCWARLSFASWRFRAQIDSGHQLATGGPFRFVRHPTYAGLDLLAFGTALWIPTPVVWLGTLVMAVVGDLRACAEELLLARLSQLEGSGRRKCLKIKPRPAKVCSHFPTLLSP